VTQTKHQIRSKYPDLWGLTANEVANRNSNAILSLQEYHIKQKQKLNCEVRSIKNVASYPIYLMENSVNPFDYSFDDSEIPTAYINVFHNSIRIYLLYVFYVYAISELGGTHAENILALQSKYLTTRLDSTQGAALNARFKDISSGAKLHTQEHNTGYESVNLDIPVENTIAKTFLLYNEESPLYADSKKDRNFNKTKFRGMDLALAEHLGQSKDLALKKYTQFFSTLIVEG